MKIGNREFETDRHTYIMGILNITPDSFSDGGSYQSKDAVLKRAEEMIREGCDIIDVGGESTRPGYEMISAEMEIDRVTPVIELLNKNFDIPVSLDTYKASVAKAGIEAGASMINDIWGLKYDSNIASVITEAKIPCCLVHNRNRADKLNHDLIESLSNDFKITIDIARKAGIADERIILDPGIGFGKDLRENLLLLNNLAELKKFGYPCLLGASRKSVIGLTLDLAVAERIEGTLVTTVMAVMSGYSFIRVHDIEANKRAVRMAEAILEV